MKDRIKLGSNTLYLYVGFVSERHRDDQLETYDYDYFQTELAEAAGFSETMMSADDTMPDASTLLVFQEYVNLLPKIYEANAMSEDMKKVWMNAMSKDMKKVWMNAMSKDMKKVWMNAMSKDMKKVWMNAMSKDMK